MAAAVTPTVGYAQVLVSLHRIDISLHNGDVRHQLDTQHTPVLSETTDRATVLSDMNQFNWLARAGYVPQHLLSIEHMAGLPTRC